MTESDASAMGNIESIAMGEGEGERSKLLFDTLTADALQHVLRQSSPCPRSSKWASTVPLETLDRLLRSPGCIGEAAAATFDSLEIPADAPETRSILHVADAGGVFVDTRPTKAVVLRTSQSVLEKIGGGIRRISLRFLSRTLSQTIGRYCLHLKHLSLHTRNLDSPDESNFLPMLRSFGGVLETLEIDVVCLSEGDIAAVAGCCANLRRLTMRQQWSSDFNWSMAPVWRAIGRSLEELEMECPEEFQINEAGVSERDDDNVGSLDFHVLAEECTRISRLSLVHFPKSLHASIVHLCTSQGETLRYFHTDTYDDDDFCKDDIGAICRMCPNAEMDVRMGQVDVDVMEAMGPQVATFELTPFVKRDVPLQEVCERVGNACEELKTVRLIREGISASGFRSLFVSPKPKLVSLVADLYGDSSATPASLFQVLAENVSTLECLDYTGPLPRTDVFPAFVASNKRLKTVSVKERMADLCGCYYEEADESVTDWGEIVRALLGSGSVEEIRCGCGRGSGRMFEGRRDAVVRAKNKRVAVAICGHQYC